MVKKYSVIVAGGSGTRLNTAIPKQFLNLDGKPVLMHTIDAFNKYDPGMRIIIVIPKKDYERWNQLCHEHNFRIPHSVAEGGETRFESVKNGLVHVPFDALVAIHDGVRPFVTEELLHAVFNAAEINGNAIPFVLPKDSVRVADGNNNKIIDRGSLRLIQTPQCFYSDTLKKAYDQQYRPEFTDDASVVEAMGEKIFLVEGAVENIKITTPLDLEFADFLVKRLCANS